MDTHDRAANAELFSILAEQRRLEALRLLQRGPTAVGDLAVSLGVSQSTASHHLAVLARGGLVAAARDGRSVRYRLVDADAVTDLLTTATSLRHAVLAQDSPCRRAGLLRPEGSASGGCGSP